MYFDTHAHLTEPEYAACLPELLHALARAGISDLILASTNLQTSRRSCLLAESVSERKASFPGIGAIPPDAPLPRLYAAVGFHPLMLPEDMEKAMEELRLLLRQYPVRAIGEFGLDYYEEKRKKKPADHTLQRAYAQAQLTLCEEFSLPALIHSRGAHQETYELLMAHPKVRGILHGFSGSAELALAYGKAGWLIGIGALICRPEARKIREVAEALPLESLVVETDCPFQKLPEAESVFPGLPDSLLLKQIIRRIAALKGLSEEETRAALYQSSLRLIAPPGKRLPAT